MNNKHGIGVLSLLLLTSFAADAAKVYSWVDGNGITHPLGAGGQLQQPDRR